MTTVKIVALLISLGTLMGAGFIADDRFDQSSGLLAMSEVHKADFKAAEKRMQSSESRAIKKELRQLKKELRIIAAKTVQTEPERLMVMELQDEIQAVNIELKEAVK